MADKAITVGGLITEASEAITQREGLVEKIASLREILRHLDKAGQTSKEESDWIAQAFPPRKRGEEGEEPANGGGE